MNDAGVAAPSGRAAVPSGKGLGARLAGRLGLASWELAGLLAVMALAAAARLVNLPARGAWDADQGTETWAIWNAAITGHLPTFGSQAYSINGTFHHGAMFYDLMIPAAWLGNGDPRLVVLEIALFGIAVIPLAWWTARSIGGPAAGLAVALLAAVSPSLVDYSTFVWNPVLVDFGAALAVLGAWRAWSARSPRWWLVAAAGAALAGQSHLAGNVIAIPLAGWFLLDLRRGGSRLRILGWGFAAAGLFMLTWLPVIVYELGHDFAETRAMLAFGQADAPAADPFTRLFVVFVRVLAWPFTRWPLDSYVSGFPIAFLVAAGLTAGLVWWVVRVVTTAGGGSRPPLDAAVAEDDGAPRRHGRGELTAWDGTGAREGLLLVTGSLLAIVVILGLGLKEVSQIQNVNEEQYHAVADVLVLLSGGLLAGGLWTARPRGSRRLGRTLGGATLAALVAVSVSHQPPLTSPDGGWPAAQAAAERIERAAAGMPLALASLPDFKSTDAYGYPLARDGVATVGTASAGAIALVCDAGWVERCGGEAEAAWAAAAAASGAGATLTLVDRFEAAPGRTISIYRRGP
jgi:hypothetical protein